MATPKLPSPAAPSRGHRRALSDGLSATMSKENAARISSRIDDELKREAHRNKKARVNEVRVLLLGQADSGKSTLQKHFQLMYASKTLDNERVSWAAIVYANLIKAIRIIFAEVEYEISQSTPDEPLSSRRVQQEIAKLRVRLLPLMALENTLASELSGGTSVVGQTNEACVRSGWQSLISPKRAAHGSTSGTGSLDFANARETTALVARMLATTVDDIDALWNHEAVMFYLNRNRIRLEESAAYFFRHIQRIAEPEYMPTNDDILHVRLRTLGVMQHNFTVVMPGTGLSYDWRVFDVGGARGQRHAWAPFFEDATAIIFLAPLSAFNQFLEEDPRTNRLDDSLQLFGTICANKLLVGAHLVLLLNKMDVLRQKLDAGVQIRKYITSFGERPNNFETAAAYFRSHFMATHRKKDANPRRHLFVHFTSMLDIQATQSIIQTVGEAIIRSHLVELHRV